MPRFNKRRVLEKTYYILRQTGKPMKLYVRNTPATSSANTASGIPVDLFAALEEPPEVASEFTVYGFYGKFEEEDVESRDEGGRFRQVKGLLTVPFAYRSLLAKADYIDPYGDGSRFVKYGNTVVDEERLLIYQTIQGTHFSSNEITS